MSIFDKLKRQARGESLSCEQANRFLMDYLEGSLEDRTQARFETHLRDCPTCDHFLDQYRATITLVHDESDVEPPEELVTRTLDFLKNHFDDDT